MILLINGLFTQSLQSLRYAQKIIPGISTICLRSSARLRRELSLRRAQSNRYFFRMPCLRACLSAVQTAQAGADRQRTGKLDLEGNPHKSTESFIEVKSCSNRCGAKWSSSSTKLLISPIPHSPIFIPSYVRSIPI